MAVARPAADAGVRGGAGAAGPGAPGAIGGTFRSTSGDSLLTSSVPCDAIPVEAHRKTGPRPIVDPWGGLGDEPLEPLYPAFTCSDPDGDGVSDYTLSGLSAGFPNRILVGSDTGCDVANPASIAHVVHIDGLPDRLLPADFARTYDLTGEAYTDLCGAQTPAVQTWQETDVDPVINPADAVFTVVDDGSWLAFSSDTATPSLDSTSLSVLSAAPILQVQSWYALR